MVSHAVTFSLNSGDNFGTLRYFLTDEEKCCRDLMRLQQVQESGGHIAVRAIVKSQIDPAFRCPPDNIGQHLRP